jgi:hypothetical protein
MVVILPEGINSKGQAYEYLTLQYLQKFHNYRLIHPPIFFKTTSGKWRQVDGVVEKDKTRYSVESRCRSEPLTDTGIWEITVLSKNLGFKKTVISSFSGFKLLEDCDIADADLYSFDDIISALNPDYLYNSNLDRVQYSDNHITIEGCGKVKADLTESELKSGNAVFVKDWVGVWTKRLPCLDECIAIPEEPTIEHPHYPEVYQSNTGYLWLLEDTLKGFANMDVKSIIELMMLLNKLNREEIEYDKIHLNILALKPTISKNSLYNGIRNLRCMGLTKKCGERLMIDREKISRFISNEGFRINSFRDYCETWAPYKFINDLLKNNDFKSTLQLQEYIEGIYSEHYPYTRNLFNVNKLRGILNLIEFFNKTG